jgi:uracil phosphoribosyltransferase
MPIKQNQIYTNCYEVTHPLLKHKLSILRDKNTYTKEFKELTKEISMLLAYEATINLPLTTQLIHTPLESFEAPVLSGKKPVILTILRAGIVMVDGFLTLMPSARVAHIGLYRDEKTLKPTQYYFKIPPHSKDRQFYICDPMLATGGSALVAIERLKEEGVRKITFACIVAAPEGIEKIFKKHPDITVICAAIDRKLNSKGYILPGLGDAGDRMFGTK